MFENEDEDDFLSPGFHDDLARFENMLRLGKADFFDADQLETFIDHYLMSNQLKKAMDCVNHAISFYPHNLNFKLRKAQVLSNSGRLNEAMEVLISFEKLIGDDLEFLLTKASVHSQLRDSKSAVKYFEKALDLATEEEKDDIFLDLAAEYQDMGAFDQAIKTLERAIQSNPENEAAVHELAYCHDLRNDMEKCVQIYLNYLDIKPYSFTTWYNLGNAYSKAEKYADALWAYDYCTVINQDFSSAYFNMGNIYLALEKFSKAIECFERCIEIDGEDAMAYVYIAEAYEHLEEYDLSMHFYRKGLEIQPDLPEPWLGMGIVLDLMERTQEALPFLKKAVQLEDLNPDYLHVYASALSKTGDTVEAFKHLYKALSINPLSDELLVDITDLRALDNVVYAYEEMDDHINSYELDGISLVHRVKYAWLAGRQMDALNFYRALIIEDVNLAKQLLDVFPEAEQIPLLYELYLMTQ
jgi:tetratricopeptide (TPR) repeat protein